jgi:hypothetical protein
VVLLQVGGECWNQDQVHRSVTEHPIGDVTPPLLTYRTSEPVIGPARTPPFAGLTSCIVSPGWQAVYPAARSRERG